MLRHQAGPGHPERPARLAAVVDALSAARLPRAEWVAPRPAALDALTRIHHPEYVARLRELAGSHAQLDPDTGMGPDSQSAAWLAAGAAVDAVDAVVEGASRRAFALVRPPGHHAEARRGMGFCLLNNIAIAAAHAVAAHGCKRVLVVDWDIHHGNGTQHVFATRDDVLFFSTHRYPFYPGTGALEEVGRGAGAGFTFNVPMPWGLGDREYGAVFEQLLLPLADAYRPDLVLVSAGFDAHRDDPLGDQRVTEDGFAAMCGMVRDLADRHAGGRLVLFLEGGYDLSGLSRSARGCAEVLCGADPPQIRSALAETRDLVGRIQEVQGRYWPVFAPG
ncbi:MAG: histone deacetylase [Deltaproteobacteria bacterium]|nr:histone deacetylase [Deltaproteobacteria bacterium]